MENQQSKDAKSSESGDPGCTPGAAEGDRETVEADLQEKESGGAENNEKNERETNSQSNARGN